MSTITKKLAGFLYNGASLTLASAPWKGKVNAVYGFNAAGTGYQVFKPTSSFNSLTQLVQDGNYILDVATVGFDLPGAVLTAAGVVAGPTLPVVLRQVEGSRSTTGNLSLALTVSGVNFVQVYGQLYELDPDVLNTLPIPRAYDDAEGAVSLAFFKDDVEVVAYSLTLS